MLANDAVQIGHSHPLAIRDVIQVARDHRAVAPLSPDVLARVEQSAAWAQSAVDHIEDSRRRGARPDAYYGINTGFGALAGQSALDSAYLTKVLSANLIASHSVGVVMLTKTPSARRADPRSLAGAGLFGRLASRSSTP
jgi:histidine ammonia-lyase